jgi:hypothetical protein
MCKQQCKHDACEHGTRHTINKARAGSDGAQQRDHARTAIVQRDAHCVGCIHGSFPVLRWTTPDAASTSLGCSGSENGTQFTDYSPMSKKTNNSGRQ